MQITQKLYVHWRADAYSDQGGRYTVWDMNMSSCRELGQPLAEKEVTFEVPNVNPRARLIDSLRQEKEEVIAEATSKAQQLEERIQQLLALPNIHSANEAGAEE